MHDTIDYPRLSAFVFDHYNSPTDVLLAAIRAECTAGGGLWMEPQPTAPAPDRIRHATHLFEIQLFGQSAVGFDADHAAQNWRKVALTVITAAAAA